MNVKSSSYTELMNSLCSFFCSFMMILQELSILALTFLTAALAVVAGEEELGQQIVVEQTFDEFPVSIIHINDFHAR